MSYDQPNLIKCERCGEQQDSTILASAIRENRGVICAKCVDALVQMQRVAARNAIISSAVRKVISRWKAEVWLREVRDKNPDLDMNFIQRPETTEVPNGS